MPNDTAINRLLYAMLSQKNLKDIDWNKVAADPVLKKEITNGHAARMRYSRFKKQMDASVGIVKPKRTNSPRKPKADKGKHVKKEKNHLGLEDEEEEQEEWKIKDELSPNAEHEEEENVASCRSVVKRERGEENGPFPGIPYTPQSQNSTPSPGFSGHGFEGNEMGEIEDIATSFGHPSALDDEMYSQMMGHEYSASVGMGMGAPKGMADSFDPLWHDQERPGMRGERQMFGDGYILVKNEPRWEDGYRR